MASILSVQAYVCDPRPEYPLVITAKRYWNPESSHLHDPDAATLILTHGTGYHKEQWEPALSDLYARAGHEGRPHIREAWSIDAPNAGDAAVLNEKILLSGYDVFDWGEYGRAVHIFLAGLGKGVDVDFTKHRLVGIGHSMGAVAMVISATYSPKVTFSTAILVDPLILPPLSTETNKKLLAVTAGTAKTRRDVWSSREEAYEACKARKTFQVWDPRVLRVFIDHGLRELPTVYYPDKTEGVTLKCSREQEVASYISYLGRMRAYDYLPFFCERFPVHFIHGAISDVIPRKLQDQVHQVQTKGKFLSAQRVEGSGHLIVQMKPAGLADAIWKVLAQEVQHTTPASKL